MAGRMTRSVAQAQPVLQNALALVDLSEQILPVWARQLVSSCQHSEEAVQQMLDAFDELGPHLDLAVRQSKEITAALAQSEGGMTQLAKACDAVLQPVLSGCTAEAVEAIHQVIAMITSCVEALENIAKPFARETQIISLQVDRMYEGFQYQDRISQMLTLLHQDMSRLRQAIHQSDTSVSAAKWLERLAATYVTEQHQQHDDTQGAVVDDGTTFF
jgi:ABC-type transporter Mla subunit MlaD